MPIDKATFERWREATRDVIKQAKNGRTSSFSDGQERFHADAIEGRGVVIELLDIEETRRFAEEILRILRGEAVNGSEKRTKFRMSGRGYIRLSATV